jgi:orotate phosphoribosyltransferase
MSLFQRGDFTLHSGQKSGWKIDCDALTDGDWEALAAMLAERLPPFGVVTGVYRGGLKLAEALRQYRNPSVPRALVVDDVLTTGASMEGAAPAVAARYPGYEVAGAVVFARGPCPDWVVPLFRMG